ncbi:hypothetical protein AM588_10011535 [Phytophthora nicotianae]|uniref:Uncharacterized protein n=1 Tax=Phytophthora nicotianae TaxID=4792 RepID=A0A0W8DQF0_PHYNI|nr:hypothetical protein AM588_10011535 [Phytophthora nicotianae]
MQQMLHLQDEVKAQQDQALKDIGVKFTEQIRQKDDAIQKMRDVYEMKLREVTMQCESMGQHMNKQISSLQQRESLLQESRAKRGILEDENSELKRKVQVLEIRIEEIAQTHSVAMEEMKLREKELEELREEIATISGDYTAQREQLEAAQDETRAHKVLADEKKTIESEVDTIRDEMANLESMNISIQSRLQEKKELAEQLERKMARLDDAATVSKNALEDEREKRRAVSRDLDDLRKAHRKLESDMAMLEIQAAEQRLEVESKDEDLRKCEEEIRHLFEADDAEAEESGMRTTKQQLSPTDPTQGAALHDRFGRNSGLSGSGSAFSSGYDVHFDSAKLMYTPNSLKYLQVG